jgi:hypothetical protein
MRIGRRNFLRRIGAALAVSPVAGLAAQALVGSVGDAPAGDATHDPAPAGSFSEMGENLDQIGGLSTTKPPKWKNYTTTYADVSKQDLIDKMREAHRKIKFTRPVAKDDRVDTYKVVCSPETAELLDKLGIEMTERRKKALEQLAQDLEDKIWASPPPKEKADIMGIDFWLTKGEKEGFNGGVPDEPKYMVDLPEWKKEREAKGDHRTTQQIFMDMQYNYICVDRRRHAVLHST